MLPFLHRLPAAIAVGLLVFSPVVWSQQSTEAEVKTVQVPVSADATIYFEDAVDGASRGNGAGQTLFVGSLDGLIRRSLVNFDLSGLVPTGSVVVDARLVLNLITASSQPFMSIYRVQGRWSEGPSMPEFDEFAESAETGDVTWLYRRYHESDEGQRQAWEFPGGDFNLDRPLLQAVGEFTQEANVVVFTGPDLVEDVQSMVSLPSQHGGWFLLGDEVSFGSAFQRYASRDHETEELRPYLEIEYTAAPDVDKVVGNYDQFVTVAGMGDRDGRGNHWRSSYEGSQAIDVELSRPATARATNDGTIYFTDTYGHSVRRIAPDGTMETIAGTNVEGYNVDDGVATEAQLDQPNGLFVMPNGNVYILDVDNDRIRRVTGDGMITTVVHDLSPQGIETGRGLWVADDESVIYYGARSELRRWDAETNGIEVIASGFDRLGNLDLDPATGDFLVVDTDAPAVWQVAMDGSQKTKLGGGGSKTTTGNPVEQMRLDAVRGVAAAGHGGYFLTTEDDGDFLYVDLEGIAHILIPGSGDGNIIGGEGEFFSDIVSLGGNKISQPYSITIAPNGDLVLTTNETGLIRVVRKGRAPIVTGVGADGNGALVVAWSSQIQRRYLVESSEDLASWIVASEVPSSSNNTSSAQRLKSPRSSTVSVSTTRNR